MSCAYPSKENLERIRRWVISTEHHVDDLMDFVRELWCWPDAHFKIIVPGAWTLITGGWSGNEEIVEALRENATFWSLYWWSSDRSGKHHFTSHRP